MGFDVGVIRLYILCGKLTACPPMTLFSFVAAFIGHGITFRPFARCGVWRLNSEPLFSGLFRIPIFTFSESSLTEDYSIMHSTTYALYLRNQRATRIGE